MLRKATRKDASGGRFVKLPNGGRSLPWKKVDVGDKLRFSDMTNFLELEELDPAEFGLVDVVEATVRDDDDNDNGDNDNGDNDNGDNEAAVEVPVTSKRRQQSDGVTDETRKTKKRAKSAPNADQDTAAAQEAEGEPLPDKAAKRKRRKARNKDRAVHTPSQAADGEAEDEQEDAAPEGAEPADAEAPTPDVAADVDMAAWDPFDLHPLLVQGLQALGYTQPTPIQLLTLPVALFENRDIVGSAETGSGKTLAFGLPLLHGLLNTSPESDQRKLRALVLTPTRELALQVADHLAAVAKFTKLRVTPIVGGVSQQKQLRLLSYRPEVVVATPGRLWELLTESQSEHLTDLSAVEYFVLDEADRMVEAGHFKELDVILDALHRSASTVVTNDEDTESTAAEVQALEDKQMSHNNKKHKGKDAKPKKADAAPATRHTFVFSATMALADSFRTKLKYLNSGKPRNKDTLASLVERVAFREDGPKIVSCSSNSVTAETLTETRIFCMAEDKDVYLYYFLMRHPGKTVVFVNSIQSGKRLVGLLTLLRLPAYALHAQMQQRQRMKNMDRFRDMAQVVLVATDVAARGLDVPAVDHVIHYHLPRTSELYVHRSGRTARASRDGLSVILVAPEELDSYKRVCKLLDRQAGLDEFPVEIEYMAALRERVTLAVKIDREEHSVKKTHAKVSWLQKQAEAMDIMLDDDLGDLQQQDSAKAKSSKGNVAKLRAQLDQLLSSAVKPKTASIRYLRQQPVTGNLPQRFSAAQAASTTSLPSAEPNVSALDVARRGTKRRQHNEHRGKKLQKQSS